jgi:alpha-L-arabinofuranosidase
VKFRCLRDIYCRSPVSGKGSLPTPSPAKRRAPDLDGRFSLKPKPIRSPESGFTPAVGVWYPPGRSLTSLPGRPAAIPGSVAGGLTTAPRISPTRPSTTCVSTNTPVPDLIDDHFYDTPRAMERTSNQYDLYSRTGPKIFVGEWASQEGRPTPDLNAALGDAAWLTGLERNSDLVRMEAYAPMLVNVNPGASQWPTNLIGYDALRSYGSPTYYVQQMFSQHHGDVVLPATLTAPGSGSQVYASVTRDSATGTIYLKVVNAADEVQPVSVAVKGGEVTDSTGEAMVLTSDSPQDTNTLSDPRKIVPVTTRVSGLGRNFQYRFKPYSVTVLQIGAGRERPDSGGNGD